MSALAPHARAPDAPFGGLRGATCAGAARPSQLAAMDTGPGWAAVAVAVVVALAGCDPRSTVVGDHLSSRYSTVAHADLGVGASLNGDVPFPADNAWNTDISDPAKYPVDPASDAIIARIGADLGLHPDFGPSPYGIPYVVVDAGQPRVSVTVDPSAGFADQSDAPPMPIPPDAPVELGAMSELRVIVLDRGASALYELQGAKRQADGSWFAMSSAVFDLRSNDVRPTQAGRCGVISADPAGLPMFPGLARYDEVAAGAIQHALRFTVAETRKAFVPPATNWISADESSDLAPMGMRVRLKASYSIPPTFTAASRVLLQALKTYGMFVAARGTSWYVSGATDSRWPIDAMVPELRQVAGSNFEVVRMEGMVTACP